MTTPSTYKHGYPPQKYSLVPSAGNFDRDPTTSDLMNPTVGGFYTIPTLWTNSSTNGAFILTSISGGDTANWQGITDASTGNVVGPASSTDLAIAIYNGITGKVIKNSLATITAAGAILTANGTAALPAWSFTGDTDTGMYHVAANTLGFAVNGAQALQLDPTGNVKAVIGNISIDTPGKQLQVKGGAVTDFIGTGTLTNGVTSPAIANTNIAATDRIFIQRIANNASTTLGMLTYTISAGASFTVTSTVIGTPGSTEAGDQSTFAYFIVRQT